MDIDPSEVVDKRIVGKLKDAQVIEVALKGGLHLLFAVKPGSKASPKHLGAGSHPAIARHIAQKSEGEDLVFNDLAKSEPIPFEAYERFLPQYEALTIELNNKFNKLP